KRLRVRRGCFSRWPACPDCQRVGRDSLVGADRVSSNRCAMTSSASPSGPDPQPSAKPREATRLESVDEIRQAVRNRRPSAADKPAADDTHAYRPMRRPPLALLCILDDGKEEGEWLRLRADHVIIGRSEGDITIPHDSMISGRHAELSRRPD